MIRFVPILLLLAGLAAPGAGSAQAFAPASREPVIQPGDRLELSIWRNPELSGVFTVAADGTLLHPLYSEVQIGGATVSEARERMQRYLERYEADPRFVFEPQYRIYVGGLVRDQNQHFVPQMSVGQAITRAGGATTSTNRHRVRLIRDGTHTVANLDDEQVAGLLQEPVRSGDQILVEERPSFTRNVLGPTLQVIQTVTALVATYVYFDAIFGR
jgi:protein involved in polysaccharide export with SLBB domain